MIKPRIKKPPVVSLRILPSAMTVAAICLGLSAVKFALENRPTEAMAFLAVAIDQCPHSRSLAGPSL